MTSVQPPDPAGDSRSALELAQTARARFETTKQAAVSGDLDHERIKACGEALLENIHRGEGQEHALWVVEIAQAMLTAVMAVNREPLPVSSQVDAASYAMSVLRDLATAAGAQGLDWARLEGAAAAGLRLADEGGYSHHETYWGLNRATASLELGWARSLAEAEQGTDSLEDLFRAEP